MKMPKPTKADLICGLLSYWDPLAFEGKAGPMFYNYEAEVLAQSIRKNSKPENVTKKVKCTNHTVGSDPMMLLVRRG